MKIKPQGNRVLVELLPYENDELEFSQGYKEVNQMAKVIEVGTGTITPTGVVGVELKAGDVVITSQTAGTMVQCEGKKYQIVEPKNIVGVIG